MDSTNTANSEAAGATEFRTIPLAFVTLFLVMSLWYIMVGNKSNTNEPPSLKGVIPILSNSYEYMTDMKGFLKRTGEALRRDSLIQVNIANRRFYLTTAPEAVQAMFRSQHVMTSDVFMLDVMAYIWGMTPDELARWRADKSGRLKTPLPGTQDTPESPRYWASHHDVYSEHLARAGPVARLADFYYGRFSDKIVNMYPLGEWQTVRVFNFFSRDMAECILTTFLGTRILDMYPDFMEATSEFESVAYHLAWGLPRWMNRRPWEVRDRYHAMTGQYLASAWQNFDWNGPDTDADWDPHFGARITRELAVWMKKTLEPQTAAGLTAAFVIGIWAHMCNSLSSIDANAIPAAMWSFMEVIRNPTLYKALQNEVQQAFIPDAETGTRNVDVKKLMALPLLQSVYMETLRMHISINITREVTQTTTMQGYSIEKGSVVQAPSTIAHYDEAIWGTEEHPASDFWAERHLKYVEGEDENGKPTYKPEFTTAGRTGSYFPYGGGVSVCPGRHFAKHEIMMTLGLLLARFDIQFVEWTNLADGSRSDRPAQNDPKYYGSVGTPPDRDMTVRWKRLW